MTIFQINNIKEITYLLQWMKLTTAGIKSV